MSATHETLELCTGRDGDDVLLLSPDVGMFTLALPRGATLAPGMVAGSLQRLGRAVELVVPAGVAGAVSSDAPTAIMTPVGHGDVLYRLDPSGASALSVAVADEAGGNGAAGLAVKAGQSGRVWHRPGPGEDPFCGPGDVLESGTALCLIEVMKTFSTVPYRSVGGLPGRARVIHWLVEDGADVQQGDSILSVEPV